jgi:hypothetical protein
VTAEALAACLPQFRGDIMQKPPQFSALKRGGKKLYELARKGACTGCKTLGVLRVSVLETWRFQCENQSRQKLTDTAVSSQSKALRNRSRVLSLVLWFWCWVALWKPRGRSVMSLAIGPAACDGLLVLGAPS